MVGRWCLLDGVGGPNEPMNQEPKPSRKASENRLKMSLVPCCPSRYQITMPRVLRRGLSHRQHPTALLHLHIATSFQPQLSQLQPVTGPCSFLTHPGLHLGRPGFLCRQMSVQGFCSASAAKCKSLPSSYSGNTMTYDRIMLDRALSLACLSSSSRGPSILLSSNGRRRLETRLSGVLRSRLVT